MFHYRLNGIHYALSFPDVHSLNVFVPGLVKQFGINYHAWHSFCFVQCLIPWQSGSLPPLPKLLERCILPTLSKTRINIIHSSPNDVSCTCQYVMKVINMCSGKRFCQSIETPSEQYICISIILIDCLIESLGFLYI